VITIHHDQGTLEFKADLNKPLMPQLRRQHIGIKGLCDGNAICGTCHVYVREDQLERLPEPDEFELDRLDAVDSRRSNSRLTCQLPTGQILDGLELTVAVV
jgi:2Fe-2S ferredoxin